MLDFRFPGPETAEFEAAYQAALMGQLVAKRCAEPEVIAATRSVDTKTLRRARFSIASPDARHSACQKRSVASCPASIFHFQSFGLGRALCGAPSFGIQGCPRPAEFSVRVHGCSHPFIGHPLDTSKVFRAKYLISLALPRGTRTPVFAVRGRYLPPLPPAAILRSPRVGAASRSTGVPSLNSVQYVLAPTGFRRQPLFLPVLPECLIGYGAHVTLRWCHDAMGRRRLARYPESNKRNFGPTYL